MFGIELEFFIVDNEGKLSNKADYVLDELKNKLSETDMTKECGHAMLELVSFPHRSSKEIFSKYFQDFETILYELEMNELGLFYYGTYPGKNTNKMREDKRYDVKKKILGKKNFLNAGKCIGFHYHYSLPRNSFNSNIRFLYPDLNDRKKQKILSLYNLYIALDPALTTLMQSSPYFEGKLMGKDSRIIAYRGDEHFDYPESLYQKQPEFGNLNDYASTYKEFLDSITNRTKKWKDLLAEQGSSYSDFAKKEGASLLDSSWKPVKISPHGTIEMRGPDVNSLHKVVALSTLMNHISKYVEKNFIKIEPGIIGNDEPFKLEGNVLHVPEQAHVLTLQREAAIYGFESQRVLKYCKSLIKLVKSLISIEMTAPLRIFSKRVDEEKSVSDEIIKFVKKEQGYSEYKEITEETAQKLAIKSSDTIFKTLIITKKMIDQVYQ
jgi:hypothetical protein